MSTGHWFDRLSARHTRRELLRAGIGGAAVAGAGSLGLAAVEPATAFAAAPCVKGCYWFANQQAPGNFQSCVSGMSNVSGVIAFDLAFASSFASSMALYGPYWGFKNGLSAGDRTIDASIENCRQQAILQQKSDAFDCLKPNCNNFDPKQKGGPCETCKASCCPDSLVETGYSCCTMGCACGNDSGACHGSVTPC